MGFCLLLLFSGFFLIYVLEDGTDKSLAKLKCFEPSRHGRIFQIVPGIAVKPHMGCSSEAPYVALASLCVIT